MPTTHYLFEVETEREGEESVRGLVERLDSAAREAGGALAEACFTTDLDHVFAVAEVPDGPALSAAVLRLPLPGVIWISGPDPVRALDTGEPAARPAAGGAGDAGALHVAEHDFGASGPEAGLAALRSAAGPARPLRAWLPADGATPTALVLYAGGTGDDVRAAASAAGATVERVGPVRPASVRAAGVPGAPG